MEFKSENTVLVVNDTPDQLHLMEVQLRKAGYHVITARDGQEGFATAQRERPLLVISDVTMPKASGIDLCRSIRKDANISDTPILLISALRTDSASAIEGLQAGADEYLEAPYDSMRLIAKVARLIERARLEVHYRDLVEQASDIIYTHDMEGRLTSINAAGARFLGRPQEKLIGMHFGEALQLDNPDVLQLGDRYADAPHQSGALQQQAEATDGAGRRRCLDFSPSLIHNRKGEAVGVRGVARDITERRDAEKALRQSQQQYEELVNSVNCIVWEADALSLKFTFVNRQAEQILGYPVEQWLSDPNFWADHILPDDRDWAVAYCLDAIKQQRPHQFEYRMITADGRVVWMRDVVTVVIEQGRVKTLRGILIDITERKRAEEALREAELLAINEYERLLDRIASLAQTFGAARDLTTIFRALRDFADVSVPCNGIFVSLYDAERNLRTAVYVWSEGEEIEASSLPSLPMTDSPHSRAVATNKIIMTNDFQSTIEGQPTVSIGNQKNPRTPRSSLVVPMTVMGRTLGAIEVQSPASAAFKDTHATALRMAANLAAVAIENVRLFERERQRVEREAEAEKMRSLGQLAAGVAHDFNNSLAAILGRTQLLLRNVTDEKQQRSLQVIETASLDAAETVRRIQTFARRAPGEQLSFISVAKLISDAIQLTRTRWEDDARAHGLRYDIGFTPAYEGRDEIEASPSEMREVLVNLIFNALDAMPDGGRIDITELKNDGFIVIEVRDTGRGVAPALRERIFEPFFTTKGPQGSGLGLAVSYGIIHRHTGTIEVDSEIGQGTTFTIRLPHTRGVSAPVARKKEIDLPTRRVLVVDDETVVREVLVDMLKELKQQVSDVGSAAEALEALRATDFDLMITDLSMPAMDGLTLAAEARKLSPELRIALATGYGQSIPGDPVDSALVDSIVNKPFQLSDLETLLCRHEQKV